MKLDGLTRRELFLMGNAVALPTLLGGRLDAAAEAAAAAGPLVAGPQIFQSIGVEPVINCRGTFTIIGGSVERPEVPFVSAAVCDVVEQENHYDRESTQPIQFR